MTSSMPSFRPTASAVVAAVAGQHDDAQSFVVQQPDRLRRRLLDRIGDADQPRQLAVDGQKHTVWPSPRSASMRPATAGQVDALVRQQSGVAQRDPRPSTSPATPLPVSDRKS